MKCSNCGHEQPPVFLVPNAAGPGVLVNAIGNVAIPANGAMQYGFNAAVAIPACAAPLTGTFFVIPCN